MQIAAMLFSQGFGTRRACAARVRDGQVSVDGRVITDPEAELQVAGLRFDVQGVSWPYAEQALVMLHKPAGYECSTRPKHHPSVLALLPVPLRTRGVQPVGRLDADTTGLLLLTDAGQLLHRLTSPRHHVDKVYQVTTRHPVTDDTPARLIAGVVLDDDPRPVRAVACTVTAPHELSLTLDEGKYHQVKRMIAAVGNRVERLHRTRFGAWELPQDLGPGQWRWSPLPPC